MSTNPQDRLTADQPVPVSPYGIAVSTPLGRRAGPWCLCVWLTVSCLLLRSALAQETLRDGFLIVRSNVPGYVYVDGISCGRTPTGPIRLDHGNHTVEVFGDDIQRSWTKTVFVQCCDVLEVNAAFDSPVVAPVVLPRPPARFPPAGGEEPVSLWPAVGFLGMGAAALSIAGYHIYQTHRVDEALHESRDGIQRDRLSEGQRIHQVDAWWSFGMSLVLVAGGAVWWWEATSGDLSLRVFSDGSGGRAVVGLDF